MLIHMIQFSSQNIIFVLCFGVGFLCCLNLMYVFIVLVKFGYMSGRLL